MSGLPKKVREAGERADAELQALQEAKKSGEGFPAAQAGSVETPPATIETPLVAAPKGTPLPVGEIDWKTEAEKAIHKFNVLNGKYTSEVPTLHEEIRVLKERLERLEAGGTPPDPAITTGGEGATTLEVPEEIKEMYGELPAWIQGVAETAAANAVKPVARQVESFTQDATADRSEAFFTALADAHADWETINGLDVFKSFLHEVVPELGVERQAIIEKAQRDMNPQPIIAQISAFKEKFGQGEQTRLQSQETPAPSGGVPAPVDTGDVDAIKESDIEAFYVSAAQGKYRGREKEYERLEAMIRTASEAGKIIFDVTPPAQV